MPYICLRLLFLFFFFFNDTATTEIYTLSLHDALPICPPDSTTRRRRTGANTGAATSQAYSRRCLTSRVSASRPSDRKSTRLNSSHSQISYAVFCLKKKKISQTCFNATVIASVLHPPLL